MRAFGLTIALVVSPASASAEDAEDGLEFEDADGLLPRQTEIAATWCRRHREPLIDTRSFAARLIQDIE